uniref:Cell division cycle protein 27 homolog n=1 Tax=Phallusia mammillata TaxID=59560 RepID=A0A6F9DWU7_9ASCI|nr:tetratricopeptide repeat protein 5-like [Phallusia mammillata]
MVLTPNMNDSTEEIVLLVDDLYKFQENFLKDHGVEMFPEKNSMVQEKAKTVLENIKMYEAKCQKTMYLLQCGRVLNILPEYKQLCEEYLSKVVKRDPSHIEAWNMLGETFWKKGDIQAAKDCFEGALRRTKNKVSLRSLSMVLRQMKPLQKGDTTKNVLQSVECAKDSVEMDTNDGTSWYILGNAYLAMFFVSEQNPQVLTLSLNAYAQAEKVDETSYYNPDLHYNRAQAYRYGEQYTLAFEGWKKAVALDPGWQEPINKAKELTKYLQIVTDLVEKKGKLKTKRIKSLLSSFKDNDLGVYGSNKSKTATKAFEKVSISSLTVGPNKEKVLLGKVVCNMAGVTLVPFTFAIMDAEENCCAVTIYNLAEGKGMIIGDSVAIPEPVFSNVNVSYDDQPFSFKSIRVDNPMVLAVNGRNLGNEYCGFVKASMFATEH